MSHDIMDSKGLSGALVVVGEVEDRLACEQAVVADAQVPAANLIK